MRLQKLLSSKRLVVLATGSKRTVTEELVGDFEKIYQRQLTERRRLNYPPYSDMVQLTFKSKDAAGARKKAIIIRKKILTVLPKGAAVRGPFQSFLVNRRGYTESHLLLTGVLSELVKIYSRLPADTVDVWPERIL